MNGIMQVMYEKLFTRTAILVILVVILTSCGKEDDGAAHVVRPVKVMQMHEPGSTTMRVFPGITLATNETTLAFQVPGQLINFPVFEGNSVKKGDIIAALDPVKYQEAVNEITAKLTRDKANFDRANILIKKGYLSIADYDTVKSAYLMTQANYNTAMTDLKNTKLFAPFDGIIAKKFVKNYEYIIAKQKIVLLQDKTNIDIEINVPESVIVHIKNNQVDKEKMFASFDALPHQTFNITLKEFTSQADPETQTFRIVFTMKRPDNVTILPGMTVSIHASMGNASQTTFYAVPSSAVITDDKNHPTLWVVDEKTMKVKRVNVKLASFSGDQIHVLSGIKSGDLVVISGAHFLTAGQEVSILK